MSVELASSELASRTVRLVSEALAKRPFVGTPDVIHMIQELSSRAFAITLNELAEIISRDVAITARIIGTANRVGYNPTGSPVTTVSHAIQVIGFERVRNLALSLLLAENAQQSLSAEEQREASAFALASGLVAQSLMADRGMGDPEVAFVCASLRNYGRLVMTAFLIDDYRRAEDMFDEIGEDRAFRKVFGLTPLELSQNLLMSSNLPKELVRSLQAVDPDMLHASMLGGPDDEMLLVSDLAVRLAEEAMKPELGPEDFKHRCSEISKRYGERFFLTHWHTKEVFQQATERLTQFSDNHRTRSLPTATLQCVAARAEDETPPEDLWLSKREKVRIRKMALPKADGAILPLNLERAGDLSPSTIAAEMGEGAEGQAGPNRLGGQEDVLSGLIEQVASYLGTAQVDMRRLLKASVDGLWKGLWLSDCIYFEVNRNGCFDPLLGKGPIMEEIRGRMNILRAGWRDVVGIALTRKEDVLIENSRDPKIENYVPGWLRNHEVRSFMVLPVNDESGTFGLFCCARTNEHPLKPSRAVLQQLKALRIHLATGKRLKG